MSRIVVLGAGICGLAAGLLLRRDGHEVVVLERDKDPVPASAEEAWERWSRTGVTQFRQTHYLTPRGRAVLEEALPDTLAALERAGGFRFNLVRLMPPLIADRTPRDGDDRFETVTARRPTVEQVLARVAGEEPGLEVRRGVSVRELAVCDYNGTPHVSGVRTDGGEELSADLVVDAMGRRSQLPRWLSAAGAAPIHEEVEDSGFIYYTRHFRSRNGGLPEFRAPLNTPIGTFSVLTIPGDNDTWSITLYTSAGDQPLKRLRDPEVWTALVAACPLHAQWLEGEPAPGVMAMGGIVDRYRSLFVGGRPVATGVALVGDAWACSNPSQGRGMTLGLRHAQLLAAVAPRLDDPDDFAEAWEAVTEAELTPWYRETVAEDRARIREIEALRSGRRPQLPDDTPDQLRGALLAAVPRDPDAFRAFLAVRSCVTRHDELFADEGFLARILELAKDSEGPPRRGPDRQELLGLLAGAGAGAGAGAAG